MCSVCTSSALHFSHSFCFISIYYCCLQSASRLLQHVFLEKWKIKNRVGRLVFASIWVLAFDRKFVSRRMFTLYTHTLTRCAAHTTRQHTYLRYIYIVTILSIRVGLLFRVVVAVSMFAVRFMPGRNDFTVFLPVFIFSLLLRLESSLASTFSFSWPTVCDQ